MSSSLGVNKLRLFLGHPNSGFVRERGGVHWNGEFVVVVVVTMLLKISYHIGFR